MLHNSHIVTTTTVCITASVSSVSVVTEFVVEWQRDTSIGCSDVNQDTMSVTGPFTSYTITGLQPANRYLITVRMYNNAGSGPASNTVPAMTEEDGKMKVGDNYLTSLPPQLPLAIRGQ